MPLNAMRIGAVLICVAFILPPEGIAGDSPESAPAIERLGRLQNLSARFRLTTTEFPSKYASVTQRTLHGDYVYNALFRFLDGRAYYDWRTDPVTLQRATAERTPITFRNVTVLTHERAEFLTENSSAPEGVGIIRAGGEPPEIPLVDFAIGLRCWRENSWIETDTLRKCDWVRESDGTLVGTRSVFPLKEYPKYQRISRWRFDPRRNYALVHYSSAEGDFVVFDVECDDFRDVSGVQLPYMVVAKQLAREDGKSVVRMRQEMSVAEYAVDDPANTPESFHMNWAGKAFVKDDRSGALIRRPTTGPITDAEIVEGRQRRQRILDEMALPRNSASSSRALLEGSAITAILIGIVIWMARRRRMKSESSK